MMEMKDEEFREVKGGERWTNEWEEKTCYKAERKQRTGGEKRVKVREEQGG